MDIDMHSAQVERLHVVETGRRRRWSDEEKLQCVPPPAGCDDATLAAPSAARALVEVLDALASLHGRVVVDALAAGV